MRYYSRRSPALKYRQFAGYSIEQLISRGICPLVCSFCGMRVVRGEKRDLTRLGDKLCNSCRKSLNKAKERRVKSGKYPGAGFPLWAYPTPSRTDEQENLIVAKFYANDHYVEEGNL